MFAVKFDYGIEKVIGRVTLATQLSFLAWAIHQIWHPDLVACIERVMWLYVAAGPIWVITCILSGLMLFTCVVYLPVVAIL